MPSEEVTERETRKDYMSHRIGLDQSLALPVKGVRVAFRRDRVAYNRAAIKWKTR